MTATGQSFKFLSNERETRQSLWSVLISGALVDFSQSTCPLQVAHKRSNVTNRRIWIEPTKRLERRRQVSKRNRRRNPNPWTRHDLKRWRDWFGLVGKKSFKKNFYFLLFVSWREVLNRNVNENCHAYRDLKRTVAVCIEIE